MRQRILTAVAGIPVMLFLLFSPWREGLLFFLAVMAVALVGLGEFYQTCSRKGAQPDLIVGYAASALFLIVSRYDRVRPVGMGLMPITLTFLIIGALIREVFNLRRRPILNVGVTLIGALYSGWLFTYLISLRNLSGAIYPAFVFESSEAVQSFFAHTGPWLLLLIFCCTWTCDSAAYFVGKTMGKRKLAPVLSPHKTFEGAVGGLVGSMIVGLLVGLWVGLPGPHALILGTLLGVTGQLGDLVKSSLKRDLGVKDFGELLPGHGGILDRFDSLLVNAPIAYYYFVYAVGMRG